MSNKYYPLGAVETSKTAKTLQILLGIACTGIAVYWIIFNLNTPEPTGNTWVTIVFITGFGVYQILAGAGFTKRYIEFSNTQIKIKKDPFLSSVTMKASDLDMIEIHPLNIVFIDKQKNKINLRFGTTYFETNEQIRDEIITFADNNSIKFEIFQDEI